MGKLLILSVTNGEQPFKKPQYLLLNLALGGDNGGEILAHLLLMFQLSINIVGIQVEL